MRDLSRLLNEKIARYVSPAPLSKDGHTQREVSIKKGWVSNETITEQVGHVTYGVPEREMTSYIRQKTCPRDSGHIKKFPPVTIPLGASRENDVKLYFT